MKEARGGAGSAEGISIILPTRRRPEQFHRMYESAMSLAAQPDAIEVSVYCDDDDEASAAHFAQAGYPNVAVTTGPRELLSTLWNKAYEAASGPIYMHAGDDIVFRTEGWDELVRNAFAQFPDRIAFVYGRDGIQNQGLGTHGFIHQNWIRAVGYFLPPYFASDYNDTWLNDVSEAIGRRVYLEELYTEHMHPMAGKGEWDATHQERMARGREHNVNALYPALAHLRDEDAAKLRAFIEQEAAQCV